MTFLKAIIVKLAKIMITSSSIFLFLNFRGLALVNLTVQIFPIHFIFETSSLPIRSKELLELII